MSQYVRSTVETKSQSRELESSQISLVLCKERSLTTRRLGFRPFGQVSCSLAQLRIGGIQVTLPRDHLLWIFVGTVFAIFKRWVEERYLIVGQHVVPEPHSGCTVTVGVEIIVDLILPASLRSKVWQVQTKTSSMDTISVV